MYRKAYQAHQRRLTDPYGRELPGYLGEGSADVRGVVVIVHDFFGLTEHVKTLANRLRAQGFVTFAPDLYRGRVAKTRDEAGELARTIAGTWKNIATELGLGVGALIHRHPSAKVGVVGFGMGGAAALVAAAAVNTVTAAVTFYGIPQDVTVERPMVWIQGHFAARDQKCTPERANDLEGSLRNQGIRSEFHRYDADNGFFNSSRADVYSEVNAALAWERMVFFLRATLG